MKLYSDDGYATSIDVAVDVFSRLPLKIIRQWPGETFGDIPGNILALRWLPQQDLLGDARMIRARNPVYLHLLSSRSRELPRFYHSRRPE